jgi:hypothetical protein
MIQELSHPFCECHLHTSGSSQWCCEHKNLCIHPIWKTNIRTTNTNCNNFYDIIAITYLYIDISSASRVIHSRLNGSLYHCYHILKVRECSKPIETNWLRLYGSDQCDRFGIQDLVVFGLIDWIIKLVQRKPFNYPNVL